jgi:hypothetical protein
MPQAFPGIARQAVAEDVHRVIEYTTSSPRKQTTPAAAIGLSCASFMPSSGPSLI